jgi:predicted anti-sigma-YlaC factor YlaD
MSTICQFAKEKLDDYKKNIVMSSAELQQIRDHLKICPACQEFVSGKNLSSMLKEAYSELPPSPAPQFYENLREKLNGVDGSAQHTLFSEIMLQTGWKLVPVMTAFILFLTGLLAYFYEDISSVQASSSLEDVVLYGDTPLTEDLVLTVLSIQEVYDGE